MRLLIISFLSLWPLLAMASETVMTVSGHNEVLKFSKDDFNEIDTAFDARLNEHVVFFKFNNDATIIFSKFTYDQIGKTINIRVCDELIISPKIISAIYGGAGRLSNLGSKEKAEELAQALRAGTCK